MAFDSSTPITVTFVQSPSVASTGSGGGNKQWLKIEFHYSIALPNGNAGTYLDEMQFKIWVEGVDLFASTAAVPGEGIAVALTGSVTYADLPVGKDVYGAFYISPSTLARYSKTPTDFDRKFNVHIEANQGGKVMDLIDKNKEPDPEWYKKLAPVPGVVYRQNQCAFIVSDPDRYPPILIPDK